MGYQTRITVSSHTGPNAIGIIGSLNKRRHEMISLKEITAYQERNIFDLYFAVGWTNYTDKPEMLKKAFENSLYVLGAYDDQHLVGLIRVVGDGHSIVYIQDILVLPNYQRQGLGGVLIKKVLERFKAVYQIVLLTDKQEQTIDFYSRFGFQLTSDLELVSFIHRNL